MRSSGNHLRETAGRAIMSGVRLLERLLPPMGLRWLLWPAAAIVALVELVFGPQIRVAASLPPAPKAASSSCFIRWRARTQFHLQRALLFIPDRFATDPWRRRFHLRGLPFYERTPFAGRPVVLASLHTSPLFLLRYALRAYGLPVADLIAQSSNERNPLKVRKDELSDLGSGIRDVPHVFHPDDLAAARRFLTPGNFLLVQVDHQRGKLVEVPVESGVFCMASGAIRLAAATGAVLVPCVMAETSPWRFTVHFGKPVPSEWLGEKPDLVAAGRHLYDEFLPFLQEHSTQCTGEVLDCWQPATTTKQTEAAATN